jgi:hypothetical protein
MVMVQLQCGRNQKRWQGWGVCLALGVLLAASGVAQEAPSKKAKGRLPPYYAGVVSDQQRQAIYAIQEKYAAQIAALQEQLAALARQRDMEIEGVLTAEQRAKVRELQEAAAAKRKKGAADSGAPGESDPSAPASSAGGSAKGADGKAPSKSSPKNK